MLIPHYSLVEWDKERWLNFSPIEFACPCCGEFWYDEDVFDMCQFVRNYMGKAVYINSAHRCRFHNVRVGGKPLSIHKMIAIDFSSVGHDLAKLNDACKQAGFTGRGYYVTFTHRDTGRSRRWWTPGGYKRWSGLIY